MTRTRCLRSAIFSLARWTRLGSARHHVLLLALLLALWASPAQSHDPSAWGGLFRSRDHGATWVSANRGQVVAGAIALAISPTDVNHLLLGAESGLLRSRNGGRDWTIEAPGVVVGPVFALAFAADGHGRWFRLALGSLAAKPGTAGGRRRLLRAQRRLEPLFAAEKPVASIWPAGPDYIAAMIGARRGRALAASPMKPRQRYSWCTAHPRRFTPS